MSGGLDADRLVDLVDAAVHGLNVVGRDVVEVTTGRGRNQAAHAGARCLAQRVLASAPYRAAGPGWYGYPPR
jgi:arginase family enzyme